MYKYFHTKFNVPSSTGSLVPGIKPRAKGKLCMVAIILYSLNPPQKKLHIFECVLQNIISRPQIVTSVNLASQFCMSTILLLLTAGN
jgi:hypothetical protein